MAYRLACFLLILATSARSAHADGVADPASHWAWRKPVRPALPGVKDAAWVRNPIDAFVLKRIEAAGLRPAPEATPEQWLRRVTFDLIGLPPTPNEIDAFIEAVRARGDAAYAEVVDRLLADPHHGERWGRHWLDLARFAETNGFEHDEVRPNAWRYRDYVIRAFGADKPYDRFVREQIAGDELFPDQPEALIATGFHLLGPDMTDAASQKQRRQNTLDDMTDTTSLVFLGLTIGCARCHDHKFEPIPQTDFYKLQAFFAPADFRKDLVLADRAAREKQARAEAAWQERLRPVQQRLVELERPHREALRKSRLARLTPEARIAHQTAAAKRTPKQKELVAQTSRALNISLKEIEALLSPEERTRRLELQRQAKQIEAGKPAPLPTAMGLHAGKGPPPKTHLLERGELNQPGPEVHPGWPEVLARGFAVPRIDARKSGAGRRSALAEWLTRADHPLTSRVMANRVWHHHFGKGIVPTPSDFGVRGEPPTHPDLLDWLAREFVEPTIPHGKEKPRPWSLHHLHRLMLLSSTYRQSTRAEHATTAKDPDNRLLARMNRLRLEGEIIRDGLLAIGGRLDRKAGGPGVMPPLPPGMEVEAKFWKPSPNPADHVRRSVYIFARRNLRFPFLEAFDFPDSNLSCPKREQSTTAPQALALLNSGDVVRASRDLANRLVKSATSSEDRIALGFRIVLGRTPRAEEMRLSRDFLEHSPLEEWCRGLFNVNEFVFLD